MSELMRVIERYFLISILLFAFSACDHQPTLKALNEGDVMLAFGDSLTYGTGVSMSNSYPSVLQSLSGFAVINAGVPGETTEGALARLPDALTQFHPKLVLLCIGGNDMLLKLDMQSASNRIRQMIQLIQAQNSQVVLIGVPTPTLFGGVPEFYQKIADDFSIPYEDKMLNKIEKDQNLKSDAIHPNEKGYHLWAESIHALLKKVGAIK